VNRDVKSSIRVRIPELGSIDCRICGKECSIRDEVNFCQVSCDSEELGEKLRFVIFGSDRSTLAS